MNRSTLSLVFALVVMALAAPGADQLVTAGVDHGEAASYLWLLLGFLPVFPSLGETNLIGLLLCLLR